MHATEIGACSCGQLDTSDDEADFNHRIVLLGKFRNGDFGTQRIMLFLRQFISREGAGGPPFFPS
jgi:hypothetical protein